MLIKHSPLIMQNALDQESTWRELWGAWIENPHGARPGRRGGCGGRGVGGAGCTAQTQNCTNAKKHVYVLGPPGLLAKATPHQPTPSPPKKKNDNIF